MPFLFQPPLKVLRVGYYKINSRKNLLKVRLGNGFVVLGKNILLSVVIMTITFTTLHKKARAI